MPDVDDLEANLLHVRGLFLPPFVAHMIHELTTLDPSGAIPLELLRNPIFMNARVHAVLHAQHIKNGVPIHDFLYITLCLICRA